MKDNLRSKNEKYMSNDTSCKQRKNFDIKQYATKKTLVAMQRIKSKT